jgi:FkbM family methyltransferase
MMKTLARGVLNRTGLYWPMRSAWFGLKRPPWWQGEQERVNFRARFAPKGALVFDVGANTGHYANDFLRLRRRVVSVEPNPSCAAELQRRFGWNSHFRLVRAALGGAKGTIKLHLADASAISSCDPEWIERVSASGRFEGHKWGEAVDVPMTTLDALIAEHGRPAHTKIDVEGFEAEVLKGLTQHAGMMSLEFTPELIERTIGCLERLTTLGYKEFNYSLHDACDWALPNWVSFDVILSEMRKRSGDGKTLGGDVFAR